MEEADEHAFLFGGKCGANAHRFAFGADGVYEYLLGTLHWLERPSRPLGVGCFLGDLHPDGRKLFGGNDCCGGITALNLAFVGVLEGGIDGDDPAWSRHV